METYFIYASGTGKVKIGCADNPERYRDLMQEDCPVDLVLIHTTCRDAIVRIGLQFNDEHLRGRWFTLSEAITQYLETEIGSAKMEEIPILGEIELIHVLRAEISNLRDTKKAIMNTANGRLQEIKELRREARSVPGRVHVLTDVKSRIHYHLRCGKSAYEAVTRSLDEFVGKEQFANLMQYADEFEPE